MHVPDLIINNPLDIEKLSDALEKLDLNESSLVLDVGCGRGELLAMTLERFECRGIGIEPKPDEIERAATRLAFAQDRVTLHAERLQDVDLTDIHPDAAYCIGATHAFGKPGEGLHNTLIALRDLVRPGGRLLIGEGYWRQTPDAQYLAATGMSASDLTTHEANIAIAEQLGLSLTHSDRSTTVEWDRFERLFWDAAEQLIADNPNDDDALETADHWRRWKQAYLQWGRDTLGFGLYLFCTPPASDV